MTVADPSINPHLVYADSDAYGYYTLRVTADDFVSVVDRLIEGNFATKLGCIARYITLQGELPPLLLEAVESQGRRDLCEGAHCAAYVSYVGSMQGMLLSEDPVDHRIALSTLNGDVTNMKRALLHGARNGGDVALLEKVVHDCLKADRREADFKILKRQITRARARAVA